MRLCRYAFLALSALLAHPVFAKCEFKDPRQQQQCIQQEQAQQQAQQRQQQLLQAQQAQQRAQEQQRQQQILQQQQEQSRRAQEQQRQQLEAQQQAAAQRQTEATRRQQEQAHRAGLERQRQVEEARKQQELARQAEEQRRQQAQQRTSPAPAVSRAAGMTAVTLGNGQRAFVNSQGAFFDSSGNQITHQSVAAATKGTPIITAVPAMLPPVPVQGISPNRGNTGVATVSNMPQAIPTLPSKLVVNPPSTQTAISSTPRVPASAPIAFPTATSTVHRGPVQEIGTRRTTSAPMTPSTQELQKYGVEQLASMPREQLVNLSADQRQHLNNYLSGRANAAKYEAEANKSVVSRFVQELPRQTVKVTAGAVVGAGQVAVETGKAAFDAGQRVGTPIGTALLEL